MRLIRHTHSKSSILTTLIAVTAAVGAFSASSWVRAADSITHDAAGAVHKAETKVESMAFDAIDKRSLTIDFAKGSSSISDGDARSLTALIKSFDPGMVGGGVTVAAWSDKALPVNDEAKLTDGDSALAKARLDKVEALLKSDGVASHVETYNMANQANALSQFFGGDDAKVKQAFKTAEADTPRLAETAHYLRDKGGPMKAVIVFHAPQVH